MTTSAVAIPLVVVTIFWGLIGGVAPWIVPKGVNRGIIQTMLVMTAVCCYLFWLCTFLMQVNPLFGPQVNKATLIMMQYQWKS